MSEHEDQNREQEHSTPAYLPVHRRPDLPRFLVLGALLGFIVGGALAYLGPRSTSSSPLQEVILLGFVGALLFGFLGAVAYLVADARSQRR